MTATIVLVLRIGLAVVLYYFLWRVFQTLWQDLKQQGAILSSQKKPAIHFDVTGKDGGNSVFTFRQNDVLIGRSAQCDISLADASLSANHARLSYHHGQWWLEDSNSMNGIFLNKTKITIPTVVISGDEFICGNTTFVLRVE